MKITEKSTSLGLILIILGVLLNKWIIEYVFVNDGTIDSTSVAWFVHLFDVLLVAVGFLLRKTRVNSANLLLLVSSGLGTFLIFELGARFWLFHIADHDTFTKYALASDIPSCDRIYLDTDPYLPYTLNPSYRQGNLYHNSRGFRSPEFEIPKPSGVFRIAIIGGSTVYETQVFDNSRNFPDQLQRILREQCGYGTVEVLNAGVPGYTSWESLINFAFRVLDYEPDLLIVYHSTNDVHARLVKEDAYRGDNSGYRSRWKLPRVSIAEHSVILRLIKRKLGFGSQIGLVRATTAPTSYSSSDYQEYSKMDSSRISFFQDLLRKHPPIYFERNISNIVAMALEQGVNVMIASWAHTPLFDCYASTAHYQQGFREHNLILRKIAQDKSLPFFDFAAVMPTDTVYWSDGRHVNEKGAELKARLFAQFIVNEKLIPDAFADSARTLVGEPIAN